MKKCLHPFKTRNTREEPFPRQMPPPPITSRQGNNEIKIDAPSPLEKRRSDSNPVSAKTLQCRRTPVRGENRFLPPLALLKVRRDHVGAPERDQ